MLERKCSELREGGDIFEIVLFHKQSAVFLYDLNVCGWELWDIVGEGK